MSDGSASTHGYAITVLIGLDILINALFGGQPYETVSSRVGRSILTGGWGATIPWPGFLRRHFLSSIVRVSLT